MNVIYCKEINDYLEYYENNKEEFNVERQLLIENVVKPTLKRKDVYFDEETFHNCISFVERWYYQLFPFQKFIYAFVFMYGILGGIWFLSIILKLIKMSLEIYRKRENYYGLLYFMYITVLLPNIIWWYFSDAGTLMFVIILCLVENEVEKEDENRSSISYF